MKFLRTTNTGLLLAGVLVVGCGDDGGDDGTVDIDLDSGRPDSGNDAQSIDASHDGGTKPATDSSTVMCSFTRSGITVVTNTNLSVSDPIALAVSNTGASLSWVEYLGATRTLVTSWYGSDRTSELSPAWDGGLASKADPGNVATPTGFLTVWSDNEGSSDSPNVDVRAQGWSTSGQPTAPMNLKVSNDGATTTERTPVLARGDDGNFLVVWQNDGQTYGTAQLIDATGAVIGQSHKLPNFGASSTQPSLAALNGRYVLAWADGVLSRVHMLVLNATGTPVGGDVMVDAESNAAGTVDLATSAAGGAIVFDVRVAGIRPEVRFRTFDANGALTGTERALTNQESTGSSPSIVSIAGGYLVAYRSVTAPALQLQLALLDYEGVNTGGISVSPILDIDELVTLRIAPDGKQIFLSWLDRISGTVAYNLQRTWIRCD